MQSKSDFKPFKSCRWPGFRVSILSKNTVQPNLWTVLTQTQKLSGPTQLFRYVLFVVTFRSFFRKHGHEHLWWHLGRALGAVLSLIAWFSVMPLLGNRFSGILEYRELGIFGESIISGNRHIRWHKLLFSVLSPAIGMTLYGPNWNGIYWEQNTTKGTDSLAAIIDSASPTATKTFKWIFIVSGNRKKFKILCPKYRSARKNKIFKKRLFSKIR